MKIYIFLNPSTTTFVWNWKLNERRSMCSLSFLCPMVAHPSGMTLSATKDMLQARMKIFSSQRQVLQHSESPYACIVWPTECTHWMRYLMADRWTTLLQIFPPAAQASQCLAWGCVCLSCNLKITLLFSVNVPDNRWTMKIFVYFKWSNRAGYIVNTERKVKRR